MALSIIETFGFQTTDLSDVAMAQRQSQKCPFTSRKCWKSFRYGGVTHGTCVVKPPTSGEVIVCPDRLYAESFKVLKEVGAEAFSPGINLIGPTDITSTQGQKNRVAVFGKRWGKELRVPKSALDAGGYSADWILARISESGELEEFVPVEVQSMDTTGSYQREWYRLQNLELPTGCTPTDPSINWENVNKRIIPQLLTKGNVFGREPLCQKGLFFVCPSPVYKRLIDRLGAKMSSWPMRSGGLTFRWYELASTAPPGTIRQLECSGQFSTTVENMKEAFNSTLNLPSMGVMAATIQKALDAARKPNKKK